MQKKRINLAEKYPKYFAASKRTESIAELTDEQVATLASVDSRIAELEEELEALKASKASEEEEENKAADEEEENKAADEEEDKMANGHEDKDKMASVSMKEINALKAEVNRLAALLAKTPAADSTFIDSGERSEGGGAAPKRAMSSVEMELLQLHGVKQ